MIAYLGFYDMAPVRDANDAYWSEIRRHLGHGPDRMVRPDDLWPVWRAPDLLLAQTCSLPYRQHLANDVTYVGTPDFGLPGCPPGHYRSAMVVRTGERTSTAKGQKAHQKETCVYTETLSTKK